MACTKHHQTLFHNIGSIAKRKTKKALHIEDFNNDNTEDEYVETRESQAAMEEINGSPAFGSSKILNKARIGPTGPHDKVIATMQATSHFISSPKAAPQTRGTRQTASKLAKSPPYISKEADLDFLEAYDHLHNAVGSRDGSKDDVTTEARNRDVDDCEDTVKQIEAARENMKVA
jgi:hypothetical protein